MAQMYAYDFHDFRYNPSYLYANFTKVEEMLMELMSQNLIQ